LAKERKFKKNHKKTRKTMPKRKILHNFVLHISSHVFRAWSVERGAWSVMEAATESPHTEKGARGDAKEQ
jgi:hypothetical protein